MSQLISVTEAASRLGIKPATIRKYVFLRTIPFVKIGTRCLLDEKRLDEWVRERTVEPAELKAGGCA